MRLIDADALLEKLRKTDRYFMVKFDIESEPTVELTASFMRQQAEDELIRIRAEADQRGYKRGYQYGFYSGQHTKRPTGEWIEELPSIYYCSRCRSEPFGDNFYNYCPNCGAKMINPKTLIDKDGPVLEQIAETATNFFEDETISGLIEEGEE